MRYKNKKILLMGLGGFEKGSGVSAAEFLASRGADLTITDLKTKKELTKNLAVLKKYKNIKYVLGEHRAKDFVTAEWVIKNPDVPINSPFLKIAQKRKIPIDNDITLFFREYGAANVIGVTGTRGKSTVASLIYEMARRQYLGARLGGNIGESPLSWNMSLRAKRSNPVVLELSSFQLHNLDTIKMSPHVAVWTNFYPDHLNKYPTLADYRKDKEKIFKYQKEEDIVVLNWDDKVLRKIDEKLSIRDFAPTISCFSLSEQIKNGAYLKDGHFVFAENGNETRVCPVSATKLLGEHNQANILAAICAARVYGIKWPAIRAAIYEFKGVPDRLEIIKKINGVTFVNDCTATSPEAAMAALKSFPAGKIILISGGNSKGSSLKELAATIAVRVRVLILVPGNANEKLRHLPDVILSEAKNLQEAIAQAFKKATPGDTILFSPGLTWLLRQNEFVRGEEFKKIVKNLKK